MPHMQCIRATKKPLGLPTVWATIRRRYKAWLVVAAGLPLAACSQLSGLLHSDIAPAPADAAVVASQTSQPSQPGIADNKAPTAALPATAAPVTRAEAQPLPLNAATPTDTVDPSHAASVSKTPVAHASTPASTSATTTAAVATTPTTVSDSAKPYFVHVGAFAVPTNANSAYQKVLSTGIMVTTQEVDTPKGRLTRVRAGPFLTRADADAAAKRIHELELDAVVLRDAPVH